jgi:hypothetical protein
MKKIGLSADGYERIVEKIRSIEDVMAKGFFDPEAALRYLRMANNGLRELLQILREVCLVVPDAADPPGPGGGAA